MEIRLRDIASELGLGFEGDGDLVITGVAGLKEAGEGDISFLANPKYASELKATAASAVVVGEGVDSPCPGVIRADNPYHAFSRIMWMFAPRPDIPKGVADGAHVDDSAVIADSASVMPNAFIAPGARVGEDTTVYPGVYIGHGSSVGNGCIIYPNVTIRDGVRIGDRVIIHPGCVIGGDGFGFATLGGTHHKIPQVGGVVIEDDVEMGSNTTIDRGALEDTVIGRGTKIDNLVMIAHNVKIGPDCLIVAQVGISGSVVIGHHVVLAGQVGVVGHITIEDGVQVGAKSGVMKNLKESEGYSGIPAMPHKTWLKSQAVVHRLPEIRRELNDLKQKVAKLESGE